MKRAALIALMICLTGACTRPATTLAVQPSATYELRLCAVPDLRTSSNSNDAGGSIVFGVTLTNAANSPCILTGPPQVTLTGDGRALEVEIAQADQEPAPEGVPPAALKISPGESAIAILVWQNYCGETPADDLTIHLGLTIDQTLEITVDGVIIPQCETKNKPSTLTIYPYSYPP